MTDYELLKIEEYFLNKDLKKDFHKHIESMSRRDLAEIVDCFILVQEELFAQAEVPR